MPEIKIKIKKTLPPTVLEFLLCKAFCETTESDLQNRRAMNKSKSHILFCYYEFTLQRKHQCRQYERSECQNKNKEHKQRPKWSDKKGNGRLHFRGTPPAYKRNA